jgi:hypothetical protein
MKTVNPNIKRHGDRTATEAGFEVGWNGGPASENPYTWARNRRHWEKARQDGAAANKRYWIMHAKKVREGTR